MQEYFKILGVSETATQEEIDVAYKTLKAKYSKDRFLEGEAGNEAARNLTKLEGAYAEILSVRKEATANTEGSATKDYSEIEKLIKDGKIDIAQEKLDNFSERDAEWHYLQSVVFYKKNWTNESKKQLEIAMNMEPYTTKYSDAYSKLKAKMDFNERQFHSGNANYNSQNAGNPNDPNYNNRQMGDSGCGSFFDCCTTWCCMNMLCNGCCR